MFDRTAHFSGRGGLQGLVGTTAVARDGTVVARLQLDDGSEYAVPSALLELQADGTYRLPLTAEQLATYEGWPRIEGHEPATERALPLPASDEAISSSESHVFPVIEEEVAVGKRTTRSVVRVSKTTTSREVTVDDPVFREEFEITRVPVNAVVPSPVSPRQEGDTYIVPILEEVLVTEKQLVLREELHIVRKREVTHQPQTVTLRREEVQVERLEDVLAGGDREDEQGVE